MSDSKVTGHWHRFEDNFQTSPLDFYTKVEAALALRNLPGIEVTRVEHKEGGVGSPARTHLRIRRGSHLVDVCCAHYARGTFFSWWAQKPGGSVLAVVAIFIAFLSFFFFSFRGLAGSFFGGSGIFFLLALLVFPALFFFGYIISQDGGELEEEILATPYIGRLYDILYNPNSFYRQDIAIMFRENASAAVFEAVDEVLTEGQRSPLTLEERKPSVKDLPG